MLTHFGKEELNRLVASQGGPHVSIFLPTHSSAVDAKQDVIRFKNQLREAEIQLADDWMREGDVAEFLGPLKALVYDEAFWATRQNGLAFFLARDELHMYRLGTPLEEKLSISRDYFIRPMISAVHQPSRGFVLTLSEHKVRLYEIEDESIHSVAISDLPDNLEAMLNYTSVDRGQQTHAGGSPREGKRKTVFHGHGGKADTHKEDLQHFFRAVDESILARLRESEALLILACIDTWFPIYETVNSYTNLSSEYLPGNADYLSPQEILQKARPILLAKSEERKNEVLQKVQEHLHTSRASADAAEVIRAAFQGRIHTLFFEQNARIDGRFDATAQTTVLHPCDKPNQHNPYYSDLVEQTLVQTLRHNGEAYSMTLASMPEQSSLAALFRY
jgi:Bacterial archaeo-eukaryotic release factor family 3